MFPFILLCVIVLGCVFAPFFMKSDTSNDPDVY